MNAGFSYTDSNPFPKELKNYFQGNSETEDSQKLESFFDENPSVKKAFVEWTRDHQSLVEYTPRLYRALELATANEEYEVLAKSINSVYQKLFGDNDTAKTIQKLLTSDPKDVDKLPNNFLKESVELYKCGVLDRNQLLRLIDCLQKTFNNDSHYYLDCQFKKEAPDLRNIDDLIILRRIFSLEDAAGFIPLNYIKIAVKLVPFLNELPIQQLIPLLSIQNRYDGTTVLHDQMLLNLLDPIFIKLESHQLYQVLAIADRRGMLPLHYTHLFELLAPLLNHLNDSQFISLLLIKDNEGLTLLDRPANFELTLPLIIQKLEAQDCIKILSGINKDGNPLLDTENFRLVLPYLINFSAEDLNSLFSVHYLHGDTLLHNPQIYQLAKPLFSKLNPKVFEIKNNEGISVQESATNRSSMKWLTKNKEGVNAKSLSEDEYKTKAAELKTAFNALWGTFVFGSKEGEVPAEYLETKEKIRSPEDLEKARQLIKQKLDIMIDKITDRTTWVGTPPENQKEALLQFYSLMLLNFERIFELWKTESNPVVKAGTLIDLAKIELAGRCAAAYQSEIEQTKMILESTHNTQSNAENTSMDSAFTKIAQTCLVKCIETVVQQKHQGNAHDYSQFLYSVGLQAVPDPLAKRTVEACHNEIIDEWTVRKIVNDFLVGFQHMDFDTALYWFQQVTPDEFGQEFLAHLPKVEAMEQQYLKEASEQLGGNLAAAMVFQSPEGANLKPLAQLPLRKFVSETVYNQLKEASSLADMEAIEIQQKMDMESLSNRRREVAATIANLRKITIESRNEAQEKELQAAIKEQSTLQQTFIGIANEFNRMKTGTIHKIKLKELLEKSGVSLSPIDLSRVIEAKKTYDEKVSGLVDELDINFNPEQGSLSNALKYNRKLEFAKQFFTNNKLNASGALFILSRIGVIEHQI